MARRGFTLTELVMALVVGAIIVLTVGIISSSGISSSNKLRKEAEVYNDIHLGLDLIEHYVRRSKAIRIKPISKLLILTEDFKDENGEGEREFTFKSVGGEFSYDLKITYLSGDPSPNTSTHKILTGVKEWEFPPPDCEPKICASSDDCECTGKAIISVSLVGEKDNTPFNFSKSITKRNP